MRLRESNLNNYETDFAGSIVILLKMHHSRSLTLNNRPCICKYCCEIRSKVNLSDDLDTAALELASILYGSAAKKIYKYLKEYLNARNTNNTI